MVESRRLKVKLSKWPMVRQSPSHHEQTALPEKVRFERTSSHMERVTHWKRPPKRVRAKLGVKDLRPCSRMNASSVANAQPAGMFWRVTLRERTRCGATLLST